MLLKFLAIIVLIVFSFRLLARFFLPVLGKYAIRKATENMQEKRKTQTEGERVYQDEKVIIRKADSKKADKTNDSSDEYVDFEEV